MDIPNAHDLKRGYYRSHTDRISEALHNTAMQINDKRDDLAAGRSAIIEVGDTDMIPYVSDALMGRGYNVEIVQYGTISTHMVVRIA